MYKERLKYCGVFWTNNRKIKVRMFRGGTYFPIDVANWNLLVESKNNICKQPTLHHNNSNGFYSFTSLLPSQHVKTSKLVKVLL